MGLVDDELIWQPNSVKGCILISRILWFFSASFQLIVHFTKSETCVMNWNHAAGIDGEHCCMEVIFNGLLEWFLAYLLTEIILEG